MSRTNISFERRSLWLDVPLAEMGHPPLFPRVKPFENVTLGLSVETFEMYPEVDCRRGCGKLGNAKRFPRRLRRRVFPSRFAGLVVLFSRPAPWGSPPLAD